MAIPETGKLSAPEALREKQGDRRVWIVGRCVFYSLMGFVLSLARVQENGAPFGMAFVAGAGGGIGGVCALLGAALGYLTGGGLAWGIRYVAASVLIYTLAHLFQETSLERTAFFLPAAAAAVMALTGWLGSFSLPVGEVPLPAAVFLETALVFGTSYFFRDALQGGLRYTESAELRHSISRMILTACALIALSRLVLFHTVSLGRVAALLLVMCSAMKGGMLTGAAVGTVLGLAMDVTSLGAPFYTMAYALSGLLSGVFGRHGRLVFTLSFILAGALAVVCAWSTAVYISALFETFCASVFFLLLPSWLVSQTALLLQPMEKGSGESGLRRFVAQRVRNLGEAYGEVYEIVRESVEDPGNDENVARVFDRAADAVCVHCKNKNRCWNAEYMDTLSAMNDATKAMLETGSLHAADLPAHFRESCTGLEGFVAAVNSELRGRNYRRQLRLRLRESRAAAWGQYSEVAQVLGGVADELGSLNGSDPAAERRLGRYLRSLDIDADSAVYRDGSGRIHVVIESGRLSPLLRESDYLEKLSQTVGVRLCQPDELREGQSRLTLLEAEPLAVSVGIAALKKRGESVSGDRGSYFKTDAGVLCVLLSDGMGTGGEAAQDSARVVGILEHFLRSGVDPAVAMKILNSVLLLRGGDGWGYATVDLMCVDLFSGETGFYKYGAAPSFIRSGKGIRRIEGETLAAGLSPAEGTPPDMVRMRLKPGALAVIVSDGVLPDEEDGWLKALLNGEETDMKQLARTILRAAEKLYGASDDMTVLTVRVEERR